MTERWQLRLEFSIPNDGIDYRPRLEAMVAAMRETLGADFIDHASVSFVCERIDPPPQSRSRSDDIAYPSWCGTCHRDVWSDPSHDLDHAMTLLTPSQYHRWKRERDLASRGPTCVHCDRSVHDMSGSNGGRCHALHPSRSACPYCGGHVSDPATHPCVGAASPSSADKDTTIATLTARISDLESDAAYYDPTDAP